jgi:hypothetical protein
VQLAITSKQNIEIMVIMEVVQREPMASPNLAGNDGDEEPEMIIAVEEFELQDKEIKDVSEEEQAMNANNENKNHLRMDR